MEKVLQNNSWEWSRQVRNASLEKAEQMMEDAKIKERHDVGLLTNFQQYCILKFYCGGCHKNHFWGGTKKYRLGADSQEICPIKSPRQYFVREIDGVNWKEAYRFAPIAVRRAMEHDEQSLIFK